MHASFFYYFQFLTLVYIEGVNVNKLLLKAQLLPGTKKLNAFLLNCKITLVMKLVKLLLIITCRINNIPWYFLK